MASLRLCLVIAPHPPVPSYTCFRIQGDGSPWEIPAQDGFADWDLALARKPYDGNWWRINLPALRLIYRDALQVLQLPSPGFAWDSDGFAFFALRTAGQHFRLALYYQAFFQRMAPEQVIVPAKLPPKVLELLEHLGLRHGFEVIRQ